MSSTASEVRTLGRHRRDRLRVCRLLAAYAVIRISGLWVLHRAIKADHLGADSTYQRLGAWDGGWYIKLAENGYPDRLSLATVREDSTAALVFPPLYPTLMRLLHLLGLPALTAGLVVTTLAGLVAVVGVYAVARDLVSPRAAMLAALLWAAGPMTVVLSMVYSEALFVALAAWAIWLARRGWWLTAGVLGLLAGLTRSTGLAVGAAVVVAAFVAWRRGRQPGREPPGDPPSTRIRRRMVAGGVLAVLGVPSWWAYVAVVSGRVDGWFAAQDFFWGSRFDFGASVVHNGWRMLGFGGRFDALTRVVYTASFLAMLVAVVLLGVLVAHVCAIGAEHARDWWPVLAYAGVLVVLAVGSAGFEASKVRFLVPMFPLLLLPARRLAYAGGLARTATVGVVVLAGAWFGAFMLTVWPYAI